MRLWRLAAGLLVLGGCTQMEPFEPPVAGEMSPGPGLFSGPSGEFVLFRQVGEAAAEEAAPALEPPEAEPPAPRRKLTDPPPP